MKNFFRNNDFSQFFNKKSISVAKSKDDELKDIGLNTKLVKETWKYIIVISIN